MNQIAENEYFVDVYATEERLFELYKLWCDEHGIKADLSGYTIWLSENYA